MKKLSLLVLATSLLASSLSIAPATAGIQPDAGLAGPLDRVDASFSQLGIAAWIMKRSPGQFDLYMAVGARDTWGRRIPVPQTYGGVAVGKCEKRRNGGTIELKCFLQGVMEEIPAQDFTVDPLLRNASLSMAWEGGVHEIEWDSRSEPRKPETTLYPAPRFLYLSAWMWADAHARGTIFDRTLKPRRSDLSFLLQDVTVRSYGRGRGFSLAADGTFRFRDTIPLAR